MTGRDWVEAESEYVVRQRDVSVLQRPNDPRTERTANRWKQTGGWGVHSWEALADLGEVVEHTDPAAAVAADVAVGVVARTRRREEVAVGRYARRCVQEQKLASARIPG
jgi:hypothetical protein